MVFFCALKLQTEKQERIKKLKKVFQDPGAFFAGLEFNVVTMKTLLFFFTQSFTSC